MRRKNNKQMMISIINDMPDLVITHENYFDVETRKRANDITGRSESYSPNTSYPMNLATLRALVKEGRVVLVDHKEQYIGERPLGWRNHTYKYKVAGR